MLIVILFAGVLLTSSLAIAMSNGSPELPPGVTPGTGGTGIGTKLTGTLVIDFSKFHCLAPTTPDVCDMLGPDLGYAKATLKLAMTKGRNKAGDDDNDRKVEKHTFHAFLGKDVSIDDVFAVQMLLMEKLTKPIFKKFFGIDKPATSGLALTLQDVSPFNIGYVLDPVASPGTYIIDYNADPAGTPIVGFSNAVDVIVVVGPPAL